MISIGVTGHRRLIDEEQIRLGVDQAFIRIQETFPNQKIRIISPLAEGADRLVAARAMANFDAELTVPLPLEMSDYMRDFSSKTSREEFESLLERAAQAIELPPEENREASYLAAGLYVLMNCDVLIAIWDGLPARGPGGTGHIVALARDQMKPTAWIYAGSQDLQSSDTSPSSEKPGDVIFENFPEEKQLM